MARSVSSDTLVTARKTHLAGPFRKKHVAHQGGVNSSEEKCEARGNRVEPLVPADGERGVKKQTRAN